MRALVVKITAGPDAPERLSQGLTVAATAAAAGAAVTLWLAGDATWVAAPEHPQAPPIPTLPHAAPTADLLAAVLTAGTVTVCTACAARRSLTEADLLPGVRMAGSASFVEQVLADGVQALVY